MAGTTKLMTAGGGGVSLTPASSIASDVTVNVPSQNCTLDIQGPAFSAYPSVTTTLTASTDVKVTFDVEVFDTNNCFSSSRFTPNVAGYYQVNGALQVNFWNGIILTAELFKNGSYYQGGQTAYPQTVGGVRASINTIVYLNGTTDYIELYGYQYNVSSNNVVAANQWGTYFNACLVRAA